jgi:TetR/AcrR family transcriptional regulator, transcriptional repressor for nem operon
MTSSSAATDSSTRILDIAERLVQTRGFNAFSYANIADALHVTKASLHYHFPTKAKLGERLIERYRTGFLGALDGIDATAANASQKLRAYVGLYADVLRRNRMCLCGMLAAEFETLPKPMRTELQRFFEANEVWLTGVLERGRNRNELVFTGTSVDTARVLIAALEGSMMLARSHGEPSRLQATSAHMLAGLGISREATGQPTASGMGA